MISGGEAAVYQRLYFLITDIINIIATSAFSCSVNLMVVLGLKGLGLTKIELTSLAMKGASLDNVRYKVAFVPMKFGLK